MIYENEYRSEYCGKIDGKYVGSIILSISQSILFYGKEIGISMLLFAIICNGIGFYILHKKNKIQNRAGMLLMNLL